MTLRVQTAVKLWIHLFGLSGLDLNSWFARIKFQLHWLRLQHKLCCIILNISSLIVLPINAKILSLKNKLLYCALSVFNLKKMQTTYVEVLIDTRVWTTEPNQMWRIILLFWCLLLCILAWLLLYSICWLILDSYKAGTVTLLCSASSC